MPRMERIATPDVPHHGFPAKAAGQKSPDRWATTKTWVASASFHLAGPVEGVGEQPAALAAYVQARTLRIDCEENHSYQIQHSVSGPRR
jgi:hypothetical protein